MLLRSKFPGDFFSQRILISSSLRASAALGLLPLPSFKALVFSLETFSYTFKSNIFDVTDGIFAFFQMSIKLLNRPPKLKMTMARFFFLRKYLAYHVYKPIPKEGNFKKLKTRLFLGPKVLLFCL